MPGVYLNQDKKRITATIKVLKYFKDFLKSNCERMIDPYSDWQRRELTKEQAKKRLLWLINIAINRKAGVPDCPSRKYSDMYQTDLRRDYNSLIDIKNRIIVRRFNLSEMNKRFGHLLTTNYNY
jgi:hypothetical protein